MLRVFLSLCFAFCATSVFACFVPIRSVDGGALKVFDDCSFQNAGGADRGLEWIGQSAYPLPNGLVAQSVRGLGYCNETHFVGTMIADCDARRETILFNKAADDLWFADKGERPGLPVYLNTDQRQSFEAIVSHPKVTDHDLATAWAEPETGAHPDPFCGCAIATDLKDEKG